MTTVAIGDLAQNLQMRRYNSDLKTRLSTLAQELTSGQSADPAKLVSGDFAPLSAIEHSLNTLSSYQMAGSEAALMTAAMQASLTNVSDVASSLESSLLIAASSPETNLLTSTGVDAHEKLDQAIGALNASVAGRSLFSGMATDRAPLISGDEMMAALQTSLAGQTTAQGVSDVMEAWFNARGGGFETVGYVGSEEPIGDVRLGDGATLSLSITAEDQSIRDVIRGLAMGALLADGGLFAGDTTERAKLAKASAEQLLTASGPMAALQGTLGTAQERIETIQVENTSKSAILELAKSEIVGVDPYEVATELESVQAQIETLYTITARLSRLSLTDYLS
ncbi:flagellin [Actibacterium lipolyticum]|uniref:Flagellar hook-associated protein FlgL n=1 Tax=Actibacterium lipolyticum TaxID=1524263 RepID=A0A238KX88_9RHOB|nr:flagellin [Actibacterium lipolyticum]SMX47250.1 flagellar hook-associated protein FlgL [Actibacterium lipolyticum]